MPRKPRTATADQDSEHTAAAAELGQDPAPRVVRARRPAAKSTGNRGKIAARTTSGKIMSKPAMIEKVSTEIHMYLALFVSGFEAAEETRYGESCMSMAWETVRVATPDGPMVVERLEGIAARMAAMIARNDKMLARAAQSGIIGDIAVILHLAWPIGRNIMRHHGPLGVGHQSPAEQEATADEYASRFPAYQG